MTGLGGTLQRGVLCTAASYWRGPSVHSRSTCPSAPPRFENQLRFFSTPCPLGPLTGPHQPPRSTRPHHHRSVLAYLYIILSPPAPNRPTANTLSLKRTPQLSSVKDPQHLPLHFSFPHPLLILRAAPPPPQRLAAAMTTYCDVCLVECVNGGVLACRHLVCRSCGMSQSKCLVCAEIGLNARRRKIRRMAPPRASEIPQASTPKEGSPGPAFKPPRPTASRTSTEVLGRSPRVSPAIHPASPDIVVPVAPSSSPGPSNSVSPADDETTPEPPTKMQKRGSPASDSETGLMAVHGPTAYDEVRCELRAVGSAPRLARSALRTTGKVSVKVLSQFVHTVLQLPLSDQVVLRCSGEDLTDAMTLSHLVTHVWPESEGHMVLDYRISQGATGIFSYAG